MQKTRPEILDVASRYIQAVYKVMRRRNIMKTSVGRECQGLKQLLCGIIHLTLSGTNKAYKNYKENE